MLRVRRLCCDCCCTWRTTVRPALSTNVADALVHTTGEISEISDGYDAKGRELGVSDLSETMRGLNETEQLILRCVEAQLTLGRSVRYLGDEVDNRAEQELQVLVNELAGDVAGTKEHAMFQHERVSLPADSSHQHSEYQTERDHQSVYDHHWLAFCWLNV